MKTGRVSPRNSSRGGGAQGNGDTSSKKSASPIHSSPLHREFSGDTPKSHTPNSLSNINPVELNSSPTDVNMTMAGSGAPSAMGQKLLGTMPPPSQPSLSGGAQGPGMTSIREERETSQP